MVESGFEPLDFQVSYIPLCHIPLFDGASWERIILTQSQIQGRHGQIRVWSSSIYAEDYIHKRTKSVINFAHIY